VMLVRWRVAHIGAAQVGACGAEYDEDDQTGFDLLAE
jgi:hypothetical protein